MLFKEQERIPENDGNSSLLEEIEEKIATHHKTKRTEIEKWLTIEEIKQKKGHLKGDVVGKKKTGQEACTIVDPNTGDNVFDHEEINKVCKFD